jgi:hypothetical protein
MTDYSELVKRLRSEIPYWRSHEQDTQLMTEAADALEAQAREIAVLRAVLTDCADALESWVDYLYAKGSVPYERDLAAVDAARAALNGEMK